MRHLEYLEDDWDEYKYASVALTPEEMEEERRAAEDYYSGMAILAHAQRQSQLRGPTVYLDGTIQPRPMRVHWIEEGF